SVVAWAGWAVFAGYLWFIVATDQNMLDTPRLILPAIALFLGIGILFHRLPPFTRALIVAVFVVASFAEVAFAAAGFWAL
ncbi:MAG TPA: hypothetical protein VMV54_07605, partial [Acidocella sp.]|nr:hypothetical protein [Acidocella sp.]